MEDRGGVIQKQEGVEGGVKERFKGEFDRMKSFVVFLILIVERAGGTETMRGKGGSIRQRDGRAEIVAGGGVEGLRSAGRRICFRQRVILGGSPAKESERSMLVPSGGNALKTRLGFSPNPGTKEIKLREPLIGEGGKSSVRWGQRFHEILRPVTRAIAELAETFAS